MARPPSAEDRRERRGRRPERRHGTERSTTGMMFVGDGSGAEGEAEAEDEGRRRNASFSR